MTRLCFRTWWLAGLLAAHIGAQPLTQDSGEHSVGVALRVFGGGQCVRRAAIAESLEAWLGRDTLPVSWSVIVTVEETSARFSVFERGKLLALRRFEDMRETCSEREAVLGASLGLSLEALLARRAEAAQERADLTLTEVEPEPAIEREGSPLSLTAQGTFSPNTLVRPAWGGNLTLEFGSVLRPVKSSPFRTRLGLMVLWAEPAELADVPGAHLATRLFSARFGQCWGPGARSWRVQGCTDLMGGYVSGRGRGNLRALGEHLLWAAWGAGLEGRWWLLDPLALSAGAQANLQLVRPTFTVVSDSGREVEEFRAPLLGVMFHAGVTWSYR